MNKTIVSGSLAALVMACVWATAPGNAAPGNAAAGNAAAGNADDRQGDSATAVSPFKGRIVVTNSKSSPEMGVSLEDAQVQRLGDRYFLVGTAVDSGYPNDWLKGQRVWMAIDDIGVLTEFSDIEAYKQTAAGQRGSR